MVNTKRKISSRSLLFDVVVYSLLLVICILLLYPIYYILVASISSPVEVSKNPILFIPKGITTFNYRKLIVSPGIWMGYANTIKYVLLGTTVNVLITIVTAYALAQNDLPFKETISFFIIFTMFFSGGMIPSFLVVKGLNLLNTSWAIVLPGAISTWNLMVCRTYLVTQIPAELSEAAEIDGAGEYRIFLQVVLPIVKPIILVMAMFYASGHWNSWFNALIYLQDRKMYPLQIILREMLIDGETYGLIEAETSAEIAIMQTTFKYALMSISILPLMIIFPFIQKHFVKGVMIGAIKG